MCVCVFPHRYPPYTPDYAYPQVSFLSIPSYDFSCYFLPVIISKGSARSKAKVTKKRELNDVQLKMDIRLDFYGFIIVRSFSDIKKGYRPHDQCTKLCYCCL